jgi:uncharacterized protein YrrD
MLLLSNNLLNKTVASVQSGHRVAVTTGVVIDPRNLRVFALTVSTNQGQNMILHSEDIRGISPKNLIIDDNDQLMDPDDNLVRLKEVMDIKFQLINKPVHTEAGTRLGKVTDFVVQTEGFMIVKLHIGRSMMRSFSAAELIIDRSQIVQVTDTKIVVKSAVVKAKAKGLKQLFLGKSPNLSTNAAESTAQK